MDTIYILDMIGTFAFATFGSYIGLKKSFDIFGVTVCAVATAVGGGTIREIILGNVPFYFFDMNYVYIIVLGITFATAFFKHFEKFRKLLIISDDIGLVTFSLIGASAANDAGLHLFAMVFLATVTAVGGGMIRDSLINEVPHLMSSELYAAIPIMFGLAYGLSGDLVENHYYIYGLLLLFFLVRRAAIRNEFSLWRPIKNT
ncbi:TRIC cation channel family protein [Candidatus Saccharibacteria bacterium]|jgi:uncharacterized membrane protein YeiH|nr:TRIC cation channel family protein [Candidatus Saccharibacteria bacterium]MBP9132360.1 TRIC cation channel family protein [Candidatus Saccharibacteria bacterium]